MGQNIHLLYHRKIAQNNRGFSLPEILVVVALASIVILGNSVFMYDFIKDLDKIEKESMQEADLAILSRSAVNVIKRSSLSFNRLTLNDDNNDSFFDYYPDIALSNFTAGEETRQFTLKANQTNRYFYLLASEESEFDSIVYDPVHAYTVTDSASLLTDGTLAYRGINSVPSLENESGVPASQKLMTAVFKERWADGKLFAITCPTYLRQLNAAKNVDLNTVPRTASFVGKVFVDDLVPLAAAEAAIDVGNKHPLTGTPYTSLNQYLLKLPTVGGAAPFVKVEPAQLVRFEMKPNSAYPAGYADLIQKTWVNGQYINEHTVADRIKQVRFTRKSITLPLIGMEIEK
ncbi:Tfp pilus assembly protein FimT/FimU [Bdellovibrio sp. HCB2-146]|uniref:Tfp pilus assembly protein FimT/FimU n=1 Tax=Bdellovibrio sp. HCB2-146 TaxID=3394362 RepID=UPI0039BD5D45